MALWCVAVLGRRAAFSSRLVGPHCGAARKPLGQRAADVRVRTTSAPAPYASQGGALFATLAAEDGQEAPAAAAASGANVDAADDVVLKSTFLATMRDRGFLHQCTDLGALDAKLVADEAGEGEGDVFSACGDRRHRRRTAVPLLAHCCGSYALGRRRSLARSPPPPPPRLGRCDHAAVATALALWQCRDDGAASFPLSFFESRRRRERAMRCSRLEKER